MISQLIFVDPIVNEHSSFAKNISECSGRFELDQKQLKDNMGIKSWRVWIQKGPHNRYYSIQRIECREPFTFAQAFQNEVKQQNKGVCRLNQIFQEHLSKNHYLMNPVSRINQVLDLAIDPENPSIGYDFCYILPLLPGNIEAQREYCQLATKEKRELTIAACKGLGMISMKKWIQEAPDRDFVLYDEILADPIDQSRESFLNRKEDPQLLQITQSLRDQTGVSIEELFPKVSKITIFES